MEAIAIAALALSITAAWLIKTLCAMEDLRKRNSDGWTCVCIEFKRRLYTALDMIERDGGTPDIERAMHMIDESRTREERIEAEGAMAEAISEAIAGAGENASPAVGCFAESDVQIRNAMAYYNSTAEKLNRRVSSFPGLLVSGIFGFRRVPSFECDMIQSTR